MPENEKKFRKGNENQPKNRSTSDGAKFLKVKNLNQTKPNEKIQHH